MKIAILTILTLLQIFADTFDYKLKPIQLTKNSYYFYGKEEYFSKQNGGNIANTSFIITNNYVILIDAGTSELYAKQVKESIKQITNKPIKFIINTHHHPDHFLGNSAFPNADIYATNYTKKEIEKNGDLYIENMRNIILTAMDNTKLKVPNHILNKQYILLDNYKLRILYLSGHTKDDIAIYDEKTKILYSSDLVFNKRTLATPHADIQKWINSLKILKEIDYKILVPGHGKSCTTKQPIIEDIKYLNYLKNTLQNSAKKGLNIFEILDKKIPSQFRTFTMFKEEFERSVINSYPKYENSQGQ